MSVAAAQIFAEPGSAKPPYPPYHAAERLRRPRIWDVPGQAGAVTVLRGAVDRGEVGHAWAFVGPSGVGQEQAARSFAAALNCEHEETGCGECHACLRSLRGAHPAYWEFAPTGANHRVGEVRGQWLHVASRTITEGRWKILRVIDADRMNESAANAFLKALEEPPARTVWLLDVADPDELPDTITSRCRSVRFAPWGRDTLERAAGEHGVPDGPDRHLAVRAAMGSPARLRQLLMADGVADLRRHREIPRRLRSDGPGFALVAAKQIDDEMRRHVTVLREQANEVRGQLEELYGDAPPRDVVRQLEQRSSREEREARTLVAQRALDDLVGWYRDVLHVSCGGDPSDAVHSDDAAGLRADADALPARMVLACIDEVLRRREELEFNVQLSLALEALFLDLSAFGLQS